MALIGTDVAALIVFNCAAVQVVASAALMVIVQACSSLFVPSGIRNPTKELTGSVLSMVAVTVPDVSAANDFAFTTDTATLESTVIA